MKKLKFNELAVSHEILKAVSDMGFEETTPIQSLTIPLILKRRDVIGQAQTGTGKTAAFGIPIIEMLDAKNKKPQAIVLCPTRELAIQVAEEMNCLAKYKRHVSILPIFGGQPISRQIHALDRGVQIIIGTPGRVMDHLDRKTLKLDNIKMVVLDEADEMLNMGFREDIEIILKSIPEERQMAFFSATMPKPFMNLTTKYQNNPELVKLVHDKLTVPDTKQIYYEIKENMKLETLSRVVDIYDFQKSLVFCNTKSKVDEVANHLQARGYSAEGIHGDLSQAQRNRAMTKFRNGLIEILVATDVAARGIDVEDIGAVFNYDVPQDEEYYVHRIGRTGRVGKSGYAFTFVSGKGMYKLRNIQRYANVKIKREHVPTRKNVEEVKINQYFEKVRKVLEKDNNDYINMVEHLIGNENTSLEVAGALLRLALEQQENIKTQELSEKPKTKTGMARLFLSVGQKDKIKKGDMLGAVAGETGLDGGLIGRIDIHHAYSFVDVPREDVELVLSKMKNAKFKDKTINVEIAKEKKQK
jgi:ATP-dependent RNA helicase DeaD